MQDLVLLHVHSYIGTPVTLCRFGWPPRKPIGVWAFWSVRRCEMVSKRCAVRQRPTCRIEATRNDVANSDGLVSAGFSRLKGSSAPHSAQDWEGSTLPTLCLAGMQMWVNAWCRPGLGPTLGIGVSSSGGSTVGLRWRVVVRKEDRVLQFLRPDANTSLRRTAAVNFTLSGSAI